MYTTFFSTAVPRIPISAARSNSKGITDRIAIPKYPPFIGPVPADALAICLSARDRAGLKTFIAKCQTQESDFLQVADAN